MGRTRPGAGVTVRHRFAPLALFLLPIAVQIAGYWPGLITWDSIRQYDQALSGDYDDWHPPVMEWLWSKLILIQPGTAPMLIVQLVLFWGGFLGLAAWCLKERRHISFAGVFAVALLPVPLALLGAILKDSLMAGALLSAAALIVWRERLGLWATAIGIGLLVFAATLRFNAWPACLPLLLALLPASAIRTLPRFILSTLVGLAVLVAAMPVANRLLGAKRSGVELSLIIFDLSGITRFSGENQFPDTGVANPVAVNQRCYSPVKWDNYSFWARDPCPITFYDIDDAFQDTHQSPVRWWLSAIAAHPLAYLQHRAGHYNINARLFVTDDIAIDRPVPKDAPPNDWGFHIPGTVAQRWIDGAALAAAPTPLNWPIVWMALALGVLLAWPEGTALPLAASALLYGLSYFPTSVSAEMRYHLWTIIAAGLALAFAADAMVQRRVPLGRWLKLGAPPAFVALLCAAARLAG
ncbi:hypothetical protein ACFSCW_08680 [Sphingomonas tabacisoli]|uniref:Glycosyltransferase RgtA/B/C/D-like domain-containing protein n=1 Tax=Sphingomonas tabacisoli TaxID=2249466 RepID=A0ABW4I1S4_9SPHN